ncbi:MULTISPECIES: SIS domain-containing protein [unclassified Neochlamydia]|uniref:D-sedoheptulose-7-phosphate isomerase n=1 Tax=unclassified Neochlamydia TaxID=2643326 RepID=UPI001407D2A7|nr:MULTISPECIES: SIS domain-containing protein [unclassified Neochlamydia]MBS4167073.1 Phosphoheptose isomerase [Neochlamydia sp. AcF65]MBS4170762.1 Phosphoheptose isomerase [Neochlamydia sp. AcF95]NGY94417.1 Phosphoheptose isomerase [Neochlamydia sp. AcF84]
MSNSKVLTAIRQSIQAVEKLLLPHNQAFLQQAASLIAECFSRGNKLIIAGNGGSLCDAAHFAEELTGVFRQTRPALPALVLSEPGHLTCVGNDLGYENIFSRGIEALGKPGDIFVGLTTSGNSLNIVKAFEAARLYQMQIIAFLGKTGGRLKGIADLEIIIDGFETSDRIQEAHMAAIHIIIELVENRLFYSSASALGK